jgi:cell division control protein 24
MEVAASNIYARNLNNPTSQPSTRLTALMSGNPHSSTNSNHHYSSYSTFSAPRSSDSTQATNASTLFNQPTPLMTPATPFGANDSVLNSRGDEKASLFQISVNLSQRLKAFPGFAEQLQVDEAEADDDDDPVSILWRFLRRGYPLMDMFNALVPQDPIGIDEQKLKENQRGKAATFKFIQGCREKLGMTDAFMVTDLFGEDTTGFVKVCELLPRIVPPNLANRLKKGNQTCKRSSRCFGTTRSTRS